MAPKAVRAQAGGPGDGTRIQNPADNAVKSESYFLYGER